MIIKPDLIVSWPIGCDYPPFRDFVRKNRFRFSKVIIIFTPAPNAVFDYSDYVMAAMSGDGVSFGELDLSMIQGDWRDAAVKLALFLSDSQVLWFTEQDLETSEEFWSDENLLKLLNGTSQESLHCVYQGDRMHPCSIFCRRSTVEKTSKNFGILQDKLDHFGLFQLDIERMGIDVTKSDPNHYNHYNGLSHNWQLLTTYKKPNYKPEEFAEWLQKSLSCAKTVGLHEKFIKHASRGL